MAGEVEAMRRRKKMKEFERRDAKRKGMNTKNQEDVPRLLSSELEAKTKARKVGKSECGRKGKDSRNSGGWISRKKTRDEISGGSSEENSEGISGESSEEVEMKTSPKDQTPLHRLLDTPEVDCKMPCTSSRVSTSSSSSFCSLSPLSPSHLKGRFASAQNSYNSSMSDDDSESDLEQLVKETESPQRKKGSRSKFELETPELPKRRKQKQKPSKRPVIRKSSGEDSDSSDLTKYLGCGSESEVDSPNEKEVARNPLTIEKRKQRDNTPTSSQEESPASQLSIFSASQASGGGADDLWADSDGEVDGMSDDLDLTPVKTKESKSPKSPKSKIKTKSSNRNDTGEPSTPQRGHESKKIKQKKRIMSDAKDSSKVQKGQRKGEEQIEEIDPLSEKPFFENPKWPPSALEPFELRHVEGKDFVPATINRYLKPYQREGVAFMYSRVVEDKGVILGDDMGLGKTVQVIAMLAALLNKSGSGQDLIGLRERQNAIQEIVERNKAKRDRYLMAGHIVLPELENITISGAPDWAPILVVVPSSVIDNWMNEFKVWGHFGVAEYHGTSRAQSLDRVNNHLDEIMVCGHPVFHNEDDLNSLKEIKWKLIIVDEYHKFKNSKTLFYEGLKDLKEECNCQIVGLTGTLMQNNHQELWNEVDLINPGFLGTWEEFRNDSSVPIKLARTKTASDDVIEKGNEVKKWLCEKLSSFYIHRVKTDVLGADLPIKDECVIFCKLSPLQRCLYEHILDLPDFQLVKYSNAPCECGVNRNLFATFRGLKTAQEKVSYHRHHRNDFVKRRNCCFPAPLNPERGGGAPIYDPKAVLWCHQHNKDGEPEPCDTCPTCISFACMDKLYKLSSHVSLLQVPKHPDQFVKGSIPWKKAKKAYEFAKVAFPPDKLPELPGGGYVRSDGIMNDHSNLSGKMKVLRDLLPVLEKRNDRVLIFSFSTKTLDLIEHFVKAEGHQMLRLDGETPTKERQRLVDKFQKDNNYFLFLISTKAGGLGLNLTAANVVIVFDVDFNPKNDEQAQDRAYRIGQKRDVLVIRLVARGTIEELKYIRQIYKVQLEQETLGSINNENQRPTTRMFRAVEGDSTRKGELFGVENLLKFKNGLFLEEMWKPSKNADKSSLKGLEGFGLRNSRDVAKGLQERSEEEVENMGDGKEYEILDAAALRAKDKEIQSKTDNGEEDDEKSSRAEIENLLAVKHRDFLQSDKGQALYQEGDEEFDEEMGGESQVVHHVLENAECLVSAESNEVDVGVNAIVPPPPPADSFTSPRGVNPEPMVPLSSSGVDLLGPTPVRSNATSNQRVSAKRRRGSSGIATATTPRAMALVDVAGGEEISMDTGEPIDESKRSLIADAAESRKEKEDLKWNPGRKRSPSDKKGSLPKFSASDIDLPDYHTGKRKKKEDKKRKKKRKKEK